MKKLTIFLVAFTAFSFLYVPKASAAVLCEGSDYVCSGHFQIEQGLKNRLLNAFPEVPLPCYTISVRRSTGLCKDCEDFLNYTQGAAQSCENIINRVNQFAYGWEVPHAIRCAYGVSIKLKHACAPGFTQLYGQFPHVRFEKNGEWVPVLVE